MTCGWLLVVVGVVMVVGRWVAGSAVSSLKELYAPGVFVALLTR